ncbi:hypothetical protein BH24ACT12_BH24ACT12_28340 [soil metagenome]
MSNPSQDQPVEGLENLDAASMHEDLERAPEEKSSREQQPTQQIDEPAPGDDPQQERRGQHAMESPTDPPELPSEQRDSHSERTDRPE